MTSVSGKKVSNIELHPVLVAAVAAILATSGGVWAASLLYDPVNKDIMSDQIFMTGMWHMAPSFEAALPPPPTITGENLA